MTRDAHDAFLCQRDFLGRQFHAEIAARDHHRIGELHDGVEVFQRLRFFKLHHDPGAALDQFLRLRHIFRPLHEGQADVVGAVVQREREIVAVLRCQCRDRQHDVGHVDALVVGQRSADDHLGLQRIVALACHAQAQLAVIQQQRAADRCRRDNLGMRQIHARGAAGRRVEIELELLTGLQMHASAGEAADAQLGTLDIGQDADRPIELFLEFADHGEAGGVIVMRCRG